MKARVEVPGSRLDRALRDLRIESRGRAVPGFRVTAVSSGPDVLVVEIEVDPRTRLDRREQRSVHDPPRALAEAP